MNPERRRIANIGFDAGWDAHEAFAASEVAEAIEAAYREGWSDACADHLDQRSNPEHPIGARHRYNRAQERP